MAYLFVLLFQLTAFASEKTLLTLPHQVVQLPNGLQLVMVKYPSPNVIAYQIPVHAGSRNEIEKGKTGFAHFFEHLMFRGTKKRSSKAFGDLYVRLGCENNAWTGNDMTNYHGTVSKTYFPQILEAEADRFEHLAFDEKALRDEAGAVLGEYNKDVANPDFILEEKLAELAFKVHTYGHTTMGYKEDVLNFPERYKDVWPFFSRYYRPSNVSIIVVGDVDFAKTEAEVKKLWGDWKNPKLDPVTIPSEPEQTEARMLEIKVDKPTQTRITVGYKIPAFSTKNKDSAIVDLISDMYFSVTSDLQKNLKFEKKWVDTLGAGGGESHDPGMFMAALRLSEQGETKKAEILNTVQKTFQGIATDTDLPKKLEKSQKRFSNDVEVAWFSSPESLASKLAWYTNFERDLGVIDRNYQRHLEVTPNDVRNFATRYFKDQTKNTIILKSK